MKKVLLGLIAIVGMTFMAISANAQTGFKIGIFDAEGMIRFMPEYPHIDTLLQKFQVDSLAPRRDILESEFGRLDTAYKVDSAAKKPEARLQYLKDQKNQVLYQLINWQQIVQNESQRKYVQLAQPLYQKIVKALQTVVTAQHISVVLKPDAIEPAIAPNATYVVDLSIPVAKAVGIKIDDQGAGSAPATKPAGK
ncbi:MAG: hypothetical protein DI598_00740 [Pseudopedobacter saltans]|uniref:Outer membrane chaperone Skp (OmpH) n=1 Tax=Pseudopedobacter saltans TaxID=151895 RepID=A0A2W5F8M0_9SPHI|nr:MAG: hypothetical protein DI598_00740 [Pseudopedobacter saltans]